MGLAQVVPKAEGPPPSFLLPDLNFTPRKGRPGWRSSTRGPAPHRCIKASRLSLLLTLHAQISSILPFSVLHHHQSSHLERPAPNRGINSMCPTQLYTQSLTIFQQLTVSRRPRYLESMSPVILNDDAMISDSSVTVTTPLHLLVTLGLYGLALLGKAFITVCHARAARVVGMVSAGPKGPLLSPAQPPPLQ